MRGRPKHSNLLVFKIVFLGILMVPGMWLLLGNGTFLENSEKRDLAEFPSFSDSIEAFPKAFDAYFNDHFGGRNEMVLATSVLKTSLLQSSHNDDVIVGKNGWRYLNRRGMLQDHRGAIRFTDDELKKLVANLSRIDSAAKAGGAQLIIAFVPNKQSIYPEHLPWNVQRLQDSTRLDYLLEYLKAESTFCTIDLRPALLAAKSERKVYFTTDTHWTHPGAFVAYRSIMETLQPRGVNIPTMPEPAYETVDAFGDLNGMLGFSGMFAEVAEIYNLPQDGSIIIEETVSAEKRKKVHVRNKKGTGKLFFYRDSFGINLRNFLYSTFSETTVIRHNLVQFKELVDAQPDVVIYEIAERKWPDFVNFKFK
jgi:hypothetical protein